MAGDDDPVIPLINTKVMAVRIPYSVLRVVDCGHLFLLTRAKLLAPEIESFLLMLELNAMSLDDRELNSRR
jgi:pimeloyl-ACP methyl ester carboxylesterase